jgi:DNA helicase-2/ATP-dependent DNA helicase PcrA
VNYDSLKSFLRKQDKARVKDYSDKIIEALLHILSTANIKNSKGKTKRDFTKTTLLEEYASKSEKELILFRSDMVRWAKEIHNSEAFDYKVIEEIKVFIKTKFCPLFSVDIANKYINQFIVNEEPNTITEEEIKKNNIFEEDGIQVEIGTIHSVKGETHIATLYLETSYQGNHESERILEQMKGIPYLPPKKKKDIYMKETLKMAYVGMSRPRYLLCFAIQKNRFDEALNNDNGGMWEVVNI